MELLPDFGPLYTETNLNQFPVEPFNTASNLFFLAVVVYWSLRYRKQDNKSFRSFLEVGLPILFVGYIGGTIYHATRAHFGWVLMDVLPIYTLGLITSMYFCGLLGGRAFLHLKLFWGFLLLVLGVIWKVAPFLYRSPNTPTLGYAVLALTVIFPLFLDQQRRSWRELKAMFVPLILITIALGFRAMDSSHFVRTQVPIGTHWLWHSFGAATCHFLLRFMEKRALDQR